MTCPYDVSQTVVPNNSMCQFCAIDDQLWPLDQLIQQLYCLVNLLFLLSSFNKFAQEHLWTGIHSVIFLTTKLPMILSSHQSQAHPNNHLLFYQTLTKGFFGDFSFGKCFLSNLWIWTFIQRCSHLRGSHFLHNRENSSTFHIRLINTL